MQRAIAPYKFLVECKSPSIAIHSGLNQDDRIARYKLGMRKDDQQIFIETPEKKQVMMLSGTVASETRVLRKKLMQDPHEIRVDDIPCAFVSWSKVPLDNKMPPLKLEEALSDACVELLNIMGDTSTRVYSTLVCEQELLIVDREQFNKRPVFISTGHTIQGAMPPQRPGTGRPLFQHNSTPGSSLSPGYRDSIVAPRHSRDYASQ